MMFNDAAEAVGPLLQTGGNKNKNKGYKVIFAKQITIILRRRV